MEKKKSDEVLLEKLIAMIAILLIGLEVVLVAASFFVPHDLRNQYLLFFVPGIISIAYMLGKAYHHEHSRYPSWWVIS